MAKNLLQFVIQKRKERKKGGKEEREKEKQNKNGISALNLVSPWIIAVSKNLIITSALRKHLLSSGSVVNSLSAFAHSFARQHCQSIACRRNKCLQGQNPVLTVTLRVSGKAGL